MSEDVGHGLTTPESGPTSIKAFSGRQSFFPVGKSVAWAFDLDVHFQYRSWANRGDRRNPHKKGCFPLVAHKASVVVSPQ